MYLVMLTFKSMLIVPIVDFNFFKMREILEKKTEQKKTN